MLHSHTKPQLKNKIHLDATHYFIMLMLVSTCFRHHYAYHQELTKFPDTHTTRLHLISIQQQFENQTASVVTNAIVVSS